MGRSSRSANLCAAFFPVFALTYIVMTALMTVTPYSSVTFTVSGKSMKSCHSKSSILHLAVNCILAIFRYRTFISFGIQLTWAGSVDMPLFPPPTAPYG